MTDFNWHAMRWAIVCALVAAFLYIAFAWSQDNTNWASAIATMALAFATVLGTTYTILRDAVRSKQQGIVPSEDFGWPRSKLITLATFALIAAVVIGVLVGGTLSTGLILVMSHQSASPDGVGDESLDAAFELIAILASRQAAMDQLGEEGIAFISMFVAGVFYLLTCTFVGRWIGYKCTHNGLMTVVWTILIHRLVMLILDLSILGYDQYLQTLSKIGVSLWQLMIQIPAAVAFAFLGYWIGRRRRGSHYLHYLLRSLPKETNDTLLELAYGEATRLENRPVKSNE